MFPPMEAVRACLGKLVESWGLDPAEQANLTSLPKPLSNPGEWVVSKDYPKEALQSGQQAMTSFRMIVGADGLPESCNIQSATAGAGFRETACRAVMRRARFEPARDAQGNPRRSYWAETIHWVIP